MENKQYLPNPSVLTCFPMFCDNPSNESNSLNNYNFTWDGNLVPVGDTLRYDCKTDMNLERLSEMKEDTPSFIDVTCSNTGEFDYPNWEQCSEITYCGEPLAASSNGTRQWMIGEEPDDVYGTTILYGCVNGSKFDIDDDAIGDYAHLNVYCRWNKQWLPWSPLPPCIITHCVDPFSIPNDTYIIEVDSAWTPINSSKWYECADKFNETHTRYFETNRSITSFSMMCMEDGSFNFVNERENWPTCLDTVFCGAPPNATENGKLVWLYSEDGTDEYLTSVRYECVNGSQFDTNNDTIGDSFYIYNVCLWNKNWAPWPVLPPCVITHCVEPFLPPEDTFLEEKNSVWTPINLEKWYECAEKSENGNHTRFFESDRSITSFSMTCKEDGTFDFVNERDKWPTCLDTVHCGAPPNATEDGYIEWLNRDQSNVNFTNVFDEYLSKIEYKCVNGSQFDTTEDDIGDSLSIEINCLWNKKWDPWPELPNCFITHCVDPFVIPPHTELEESYPHSELVEHYYNWTAVNTFKEYRCTGSTGMKRKHTKYFEFDRSRSSFDMLCTKNGTFDFNNDTKHWPVCYEGKLRFSCI